MLTNWKVPGNIIIFVNKYGKFSHHRVYLFRIICSTEFFESSFVERMRKKLRMLDRRETYPRYQSLDYPRHQSYDFHFSYHLDWLWVEKKKKKIAISDDMQLINDNLRLWGRPCTVKKIMIWTYNGGNVDPVVTWGDPQKQIWYYYFIKL